MTTYFRAMLTSADGLAAVGDQRNMLGIRPGVDVRRATAGPGRGGMSVTAEEPARMFPGTLPKDFGGLNAETTMFHTPDLTFSLESGLAVGSIHPKKLHAVVEARAEITIDQFQMLLANTRASWVVTALPTEGTA